MEKTIARGLSVSQCWVDAQPSDSISLTLICGSISSPGTHNLSRKERCYPVQPACIRGLDDFVANVSLRKTSPLQQTRRKRFQYDRGTNS